MADNKYAPTTEDIKKASQSLNDYINEVSETHYEYDCIKFLESDGKNPCPQCRQHLPDCGYYHLRLCNCGAMERHWSSLAINSIITKGNP